MNETLNEFSLIERFFKNKTLLRDDVILGIGDDAAVLKVPAEQCLVVAMDTLVEGVHFLPKTNPFDIGYKLLAVNLNDLASMGAEPAWMSLALTLPAINSDWLEAFTDGLFDLAKRYRVQLIGGDTTQGPLTLTLEAQGFVPPHEVLSRKNAKVGDKIYVSGTLGDAGLGLQVLLNKMTLPSEAADKVLQRLNRPTPRIELGLLLRGCASSAIDISDGLVADLGHILNASHVGAVIKTDQLPISDVLRKYLPLNQAKRFALTAGDDYELCFTIAPENEDALLAQLKTNKIDCTCIGEIRKNPGIALLDFDESLSEQGFKHFK